MLSHVERAKQALSVIFAESPEATDLFNMMEYSDYTSLILMVIIPTGILLLKIFIFWEILGILIRINNILKKWR